MSVMSGYPVRNRVLNHFSSITGFCSITGLGSLVRQGQPVGTPRDSADIHSALTSGSEAVAEQR